jgi:acid phosphatase
MLISLIISIDISWGTYLEDMPYSGFEGYDYKKSVTPGQGIKVDDYVRKHNPLIQFNANTSPRRLSQQKNFTQFYVDLDNQKLPQWNHFTPNMTNNGHDTNLTFSGAWSRSFLEPLLANDYFCSRTLIQLTFDATEARNISNRVFSVLLGGAVPESLRGTKDDRFYNHYSELSTIEANWDLHTLGRWDVGANVFKLVADVTGDIYTPYDEVTGDNPSVYLNSTCPGPFTLTNKIDDYNEKPYPVPNTNAQSPKTGRTVLPSIVDMYSSMQSSNNMYYNNGVKIPDGDHPPPGY